jgi:hypothetical protein
MFRLRLRLSRSFGSRAGSDFSFVTTCFHSFYAQLLYLKVNFLRFLGKVINLIHLLDPIEYEL